jgi:hypothetical protein
MHLHSSTTALVHILNLLSLLNIESLALTLTTDPPFSLDCNARIPASNRSLYNPASEIDSWWRLAIKSSLVTGGLNDVFPEVTSCRGCGGICGQGSLAVWRVVFEVRVKKLEVVPDFAGLVVAAVYFALENCDVGLWNCQSR